MNVAVSEDSSDATAAAATEHFQAGRYDEAVKSLRTLLEQRPGDLRVSQNILVAEFFLRKKTLQDLLAGFRGLEQSFELSLESNSSKDTDESLDLSFGGVIRYNFAVLCILSGRFSDASSALDRLICSTPKSSDDLLKIKASVLFLVSQVLQCSFGAPLFLHHLAGLRGSDAAKSDYLISWFNQSGLIIAPSSPFGLSLFALRITAEWGGDLLSFPLTSDRDKPDSDENVSLKLHPLSRLLEGLLLYSQRDFAKCSTLLDSIRSQSLSLLEQNVNLRIALLNNEACLKAASSESKKEALVLFMQCIELLLKEQEEVLLSDAVSDKGRWQSQLDLYYLLPEVMYNCGVLILHTTGDPRVAFQFLKASSYAKLSKSILWLRMAECGIAWFLWQQSKERHTQNGDLIEKAFRVSKSVKFILSRAPSYLISESW